MEAPKEIFVSMLNGVDISTYHQDFRKRDTDIEYIRKDIYDKAIDALRTIHNMQMWEFQFKSYEFIEKTLKELGEVE